MPFGMSDTFIVQPLPAANAAPAWGKQPQAIAIENEVEKKRLFGIELAKPNHSNAFEAAIAAFGDNTTFALWVSSNWLSDPEVIASRDLYAASVGTKLKLLDKEQTAAKFLFIAEEKLNGRYLAEAKDRLKALELYAKIQGYLTEGGVNIDNSIKSTINNQMRVVFVEPQQKEEAKKQTIDITPNPIKEDFSPISIKLVANR